MSAQKKIFITLFVLVLMLSGLLFSRNRAVPVVPVSTATEATIILTAEGFSPKETRISVGTTITFTTTTGKDFWPASDLHPSHSIYPAFDPKEPIAASSSWSFTFKDSGTFSFHDHLSPYATGEIVVGKETGSTPVERFLSWIYYYTSERSTSGFLDSCAPYKEDRSKRLECWQGVVRKIVAREGVTKTFQWIRRLHEVDPYFSADCHVYAHEVGEGAYLAWQQGKHFAVVEEMGLCDLGFYHGFLQELVSHTGRIEDAMRFCREAEAQTYFRDESQKETVTSQCYHGMGHGIAYEWAPRLWGQDRKIVEEGIADCEELLPQTGDTPNSYLGECVNGVFGGIVGMYFGLHGFKLTMDPKDPFALCRGWSREYALHCYDSFVPPLAGAMNLDMVATGEHIMQISDAKIAQIAMRHLGFMASLTYAVDPQRYEEVIEICRKFKGTFVGDCINGFASSLVRIGTKDAGLARAKSLCDASFLAPPEQEACFGGLITQYRYTNGDAALGLLCNQSEGLLKEICFDVYKSINNSN
jgi:plastocyanin